MGFVQTVETIKKIEEKTNQQEREALEEKSKQLQLARDKQKQLKKELWGTLDQERIKVLERVDEKKKEMIDIVTLNAQRNIEKLRLKNEEKEKEVIAFIISRIFEE